MVCIVCIVCIVYKVCIVCLVCKGQFIQSKLGSNHSSFNKFVSELLTWDYDRFGSSKNISPTIFVRYHSELEFVNAVTAGGSVKFLPAV